MSDRMTAPWRAWRVPGGLASDRPLTEHERAQALATLDAVERARRLARRPTTAHDAAQGATGCLTWPYLAAAIDATTIVVAPAATRPACDAHWRTYWSPAFVAACSMSQLVAAVLHEVTHLVQDHHTRLDSLGVAPDARRRGADCAVHDVAPDVADALARLRGGIVTATACGLPAGLTAEEYAVRIADAAATAADSTGDSTDSTDSDSSDDTDSTDSDSADSADDSADSTGDSADSTGDSADDTDSSDDTDSADSDDSDDSTTTVESAAVDGEGGDLGSRRDASPGSDGAPSTHPGDAEGSEGTSVGPTAADSTADDGDDGDDADSGATGAARGGAACGGGSGAGDDSAPWELPAPGPDESAPGVSRTEAGVIRREVARRIRESAAQRGEGGGGWRRWADEVTDAHVRERPWRQILATALADAVARRGYDARSWSRPSRRAWSRGVLAPGRVRIDPLVSIVLDTSGSIDDTAIGAALADVEGIARAVGDVVVRCCDDVVYPPRRSVREARTVRSHVVGGGGTDMRVGIDAAARDRVPAPPDVIVVLTDGYTPWPERAPRSARVVVVVPTGAPETPPWARRVAVKCTE